MIPPGEREAPCALPMITETDDLQERNDDRTTLVWSLLVSGFANLMLWMVVAWAISRACKLSRPRKCAPKRRSWSRHRRSISRSTATRRRSSGSPRRSTHKSRSKSGPSARSAKPQPAAAGATHRNCADRRERAAATEAAPKKQNRGSLAEELAQQQVAFQHEAQQLNAQHAPLSVATIDPCTARVGDQNVPDEPFGQPGARRARAKATWIPLQRWIGITACTATTGSTLALSDRRHRSRQHSVALLLLTEQRSDRAASGNSRSPFRWPAISCPRGRYLYPIEKDVYEAWLARQVSESCARARRRRRLRR